MTSGIYPQEVHDPLVTAYGEITMTCTCGTVLYSSSDEIVALDDLVDAAWHHHDG